MISSAQRTRLATIIAGVAAVAALAPVASANQGPNVPRPHEQIYVNPSTGFATTIATGSRPQSGIYVNPSTGFAVRTGPHPASAVRPYTLPSSFKADVPNAAPASEPAPTTLTQPSPAGFDWPSAGIGAAAVGGLLVLLLAGMIGVGRHGRGPLAHRDALRG